MSEELRRFFFAYVAHTPEKGIVSIERLVVCKLTNSVSRTLFLEGKNHSVHLSSRALKHLYDKKPAEEFDAIMSGVVEIVRTPHRIYRNKEGKRGSVCLVSNYKDSDYLCALEITSVNDEPCVEIATIFRISDEKYLRKCALLWSRGDGYPHRSAFDAQ